MKRKFTQAQKKTIKEYYSHSKLQFREKSKLDCLNSISNSVKNSRNIGGFTACAGTFWFTWLDKTTKNKTITIHNESNWWRMKKWKKSVGRFSYENR